MKIYIRFFGIKITITSRDIANAARSQFKMSEEDYWRLIVFLDALAAKYKKG